MESFGANNQLGCLIHRSTRAQSGARFRTNGNNYGPLKIISRCCRWQTGQDDNRSDGMATRSPRFLFSSWQLLCPSLPSCKSIPSRLIGLPRNGIIGASCCKRLKGKRGVPQPRVGFAAKGSECPLLLRASLATDHGVESIKV